MCLANAVGIANQCAIQITGITVDMVNSSKVTVYYADIKLAASLFAFLFCACCGKFIYMGVRDVNQG